MKTSPELVEGQSLSVTKYLPRPFYVLYLSFEKVSI